VALVLFLSAILAFARGFTRELLSVGGWVIGAAAAFALAPTFEPMVKKIPVLGDIVAPSCELTILTSFVAVFALSLIVLSVVTAALSSAVRESALGPIDRGLGFFFGAARGVLLLVIAFWLYKFTGNELPMIEKAASYGMISDTAEILVSHAPTSMPDWLSDWIDGLMDGCRARARSVDA